VAIAKIEGISDDLSTTRMKLACDETDDRYVNVFIQAIVRETYMVGRISYVE